MDRDDGMVTSAGVVDHLVPGVVNLGLDEGEFVVALLGIGVQVDITLTWGFGVITFVDNLCVGR